MEENRSKDGSQPMEQKTFELLTREGKSNFFSPDSKWVKILIELDANNALVEVSEEEIAEINDVFYRKLVAKSEELNKTLFANKEWRILIAEALAPYPEIRNAFLFAHEKENAALYEEICMQRSKIEFIGDRSNGSMDSSLASSKRALLVDSFERVTYSHYHLKPEQREALESGYIYIHDMGNRRDSINCCLFDMKAVLHGGFEMGEMWYDEPSSLPEVFDVIASVTTNAAAQIYGGFTIEQLDSLLAEYAEKSYTQYVSEYTRPASGDIACDPDNAVDPNAAAALADARLEKDFENGFSALEKKFNSVISPRGDYPFITVSLGLGRGKYEQMAVRTALRVRKTGHGKSGHKRPVLFPKLVFLYDEKLHGKGKELYPLFREAIACSCKAMYPEYLSLTGEKGIVSETYKKYGIAISPMCCRAFLSPWFERGGETPADEADRPVFTGRFNFGVVSLNLPMILAKSRAIAETDAFRKTLDYYLEIARAIHKDTRKFLSQKKASTNPMAFMEGGLYGGRLNRDDKIEPLLESATASFGITALNELQRLYNGKSLVEDGAFALDTVRYINRKADAFRREDHIQYTVYGTPAESLCGKQAQDFRKEFGVIENVSDRAYFSNSFHCHVSENISSVEKQECEARFWDDFNGGKIQYIRIDEPRNTEAVEALVKHAMDLGLYEGINISLAYCDNCGWQWNNLKNDRPDVCPRCGRGELTLIDRMCGYIAYTRVHGKSRLNDAKMEEVSQRISM